VDRKAVRKYLAPAVKAGMAPGGPPKPPSQWEELVRGWFPELADMRLRQTTWPEIEKHRDGALVSEHEQFAILGDVTAQQHRRDRQQSSSQSVQQRHDHRSMIPTDFTQVS
jgi:hypothetical protein